MTMLKPDQAKEYSKIPTLFERGDDFQFKSSLEFTKPEFKEIKHFEVTEKIDGTNIRIVYENGELFFGGRTDNADLPSPLLEKLKSMFDLSKLKELFEGKKVTFFGEGYGAGIQNPTGKKYSDTQNFILFDINIGGFWLSYNDLSSIAAKLNIRNVPRLGFLTIDQIVEMVFEGFPSQIGDVPICEGIIAKSPSGMLDRMGNRVMFKLKYKDFQTLKFQKVKNGPKIDLNP